LHVKDCCVQVFVSFVVVFEIFLGLGLGMLFLLFLCAFDL
jgi:hypothetical protein